MKAVGTLKTLDNKTVQLFNSASNIILSDGRSVEDVLSLENEEIDNHKAAINPHNITLTMLNGVDMDLFNSTIGDINTLLDELNG